MEPTDSAIAESIRAPPAESAPHYSKGGVSMNQSAGERSPRPDDGLGLSRDFVAKVGKMPELKKGQCVRIWDGHRYRAADVVRRLPGDVYMCKLHREWAGSRFTIVHCGVFGGVV